MMLGLLVCMRWGVDGVRRSLVGLGSELGPVISLWETR